MVDEPVTPIRVLLISRHSIVLYGLEKLVASQGSRMEVTRKFTHCAEAFSQMERLSPDVILLDLDLDIKEGIDAISQLTAISKARILVYTGLSDHTVHDRAMLSGARGIIGKEEGTETILRAIEKVHANQFWQDGAGTSRLVLELSRQQSLKKQRPEQAMIEVLTPREKEIVEMMAANAGASSRAIVAKLQISESTFRNHIRSIYGKLGITTRLGLWDYANKQGLNKSET